MKSKILQVVAVAGALAVSALTVGCGKDQLADWVKSPATQGELAAIQDTAFNFALNFFKSHVGGTVKLTVDSPQTRAAMAKQVDSIQAEHPGMARATIEKQVRAGFLKAAARSRKPEVGSRKSAATGSLDPRFLFG